MRLSAYECMYLCDTVGAINDSGGLQRQVHSLWVPDP